MSDKKVERNIMIGLFFFTALIIIFAVLNTYYNQTGTPDQDNFTCPENQTVLESTFPTSAGSKTCITLEIGSGNYSAASNTSEKT